MEKTDQKRLCELLSSQAGLCAFLSELGTQTEEKSYAFENGFSVNVFSGDTSNVLCDPFEKHRKYIDAHFLITGEEKILYSENAPDRTVENYNADGDCELAVFSDYEEVEYKSGEAVLLFTNEYHAPFMTVGKERKIKKAVIKIPKEYL